jgi:hypothetical protein
LRAVSTPTPSRLAQLGTPAGRVVDREGEHRRLAAEELSRKLRLDTLARFRADEAEERVPDAVPDQAARNLVRPAQRPPPVDDARRQVDELERIEHGSPDEGDRIRFGA